MTNVLVFNPGSIPFLLFALELITLLVVTMLVRGEIVIRVMLITVALVCLPWAVGGALVLSLEDPARVEAIGRFFVGTWSLLTMAILLQIMALNGNLERRRIPLAIAGALAIASCVVTWSTDLVVDGVWELPWGTFYPAAGPLNAVHIGYSALCLGASIVVGVHDLNRREQPLSTRYIVIVSSLALWAVVDSLLLCHGVGVYPFALIPAFIAVLAVLIAVAKYDLLKVRGFNLAGALELGVFAILIPLVITLTWTAQPENLGGQGVASVVMLVPLFGAAQAAVLMIDRHLAASRAKVSAEVEQAIELFNDEILEFRSDAELSEALVEVLESTTELAEVRLLVISEPGRLRPAGDAGARVWKVDKKVSEWLSHNRAPLHASEMPTRRLGAMRPIMDRFLTDLEAEVVVPLVDREALVGLIIASSPPDDRALHDAEVLLLQEAARVTAKALTFISLFLEAEARVEIARELEVAAAVQHARTPGELRHAYSRCDVIGHYHPAAQFGGDWWTSHELPDQRVLIVLGDVTGHGVPAALVSSTAAAACQTAPSVLGASCEAVSLLELLNQAVLSVGSGQYAMSCFVAIFDTENMQLSFANAGYPFPYLCRRGRENGDKAELHPLISRGTCLGTEEPVLQASTIDLENGDVVVFCSDAVTQSQNNDGRRVGERRLQQILRNYILTAGDRACEIIVDDVLAHCGKRPVEDDLAVVVVRVGGNGNPPK